MTGGCWKIWQLARPGWFASIGIAAIVMAAASAAHPTMAATVRIATFDLSGGRPAAAPTEDAGAQTKRPSFRHTFGSERRLPEQKRLIAADSFGAAIMAPPTTLQDLGELCRLSRLFISGDTGPLHLAAAVGTPCVGLFGPVPAARNGPYGPHHVSVEPPPAFRPAWDDRKTDTQAMGGIDVERVVAAADSLLVRPAVAA